jgi:hypothetical protein
MPLSMHIIDHLLNAVLSVRVQNNSVSVTGTNAAVDMAGLHPPIIVIQTLQPRDVPAKQNEGGSTSSALKTNKQ